MFLVGCTICLSCGDNLEGDILTERLGLYVYDVNSEKERLLDVAGENIRPSVVKHFHNSHKVMYADFSEFIILDDEGRKTRIDLDSIVIDSRVFDISPDNRKIVFGGSVYRPVGGSTKFVKRGLYMYNLETEEVNFLVQDGDNGIKYPVFSNKGDKILFWSDVPKSAKCALKMYNIDTQELLKIVGHDYKVIENGFFSHDDQKIYCTIRDEILTYDLRTGEKEVLRDNVFFGDYADIHGYFYMLADEGDRNLYYSANSIDTVCAPYYIYRYNMETSTTERLCEGLAPLSITEDYILTRTTTCVGVSARPLELRDKNGVLIRKLKDGYTGSISYDGSKVVYMSSENTR